MTDSTDAMLVTRVRAGDRRAASELITRYLSASRTVALAILGNTEEAADVCQDAFVTAIEQIDDCRQPAHFGKWLLQIVRNRARDVGKSTRFRGALSIELIGLSVPETQLNDAVTAQARDRLLEALAQLPEAQRVAVLLHDLEGWTHQEIATHWDLPAGTVRSQVHHARKKLRLLMPELAPSEETA